MRVWDKATPDEQQQIRPMLAAKLGAVDRLPAEKRGELRAKIVGALHPSARVFKGVPTEPPGGYVSQTVN